MAPNFDPHSISQDDLMRYRQAAEAAWGDDTRHERYVGHPLNAVGQCYVTSRWMTKKLGGHVGLKGGHYFWVSPDKRYGVDLTGDQSVYPPEEFPEGMAVDDDDEDGWTYGEHHRQWRSGPVLYKSTEHPLFKGFRIPSPPGQENPRVHRFIEKANRAYENPNLTKTADLMGADPYPGETPQAVADHEYLYHDDPTADRETATYRFVFGNGQLHVSPEDTFSHGDLAGHSGISDPDSHDGPVAVGYAIVRNGRVTWQVSGNVSFKGLYRSLDDYTKRIGWKWDGMYDLSGNHLADDYGPKKSRILKDHETGKRIAFSIRGQTAYVSHLDPEQRQFVREAGYKLAEYPGGTDMTERMRSESPAGEDYQQWNLGDIDAPSPHSLQDDMQKGGTYKCPVCNRLFPNWRTYLLHRSQEEKETDLPDTRDDFPRLDMDKTLPPHFRDRQPFTMPVASIKEARRVEGYREALQEGWWDPDHLRHYVAYVKGEPVAAAGVTPNGRIAALRVLDEGAAPSLLSLIGLHYPHLAVTDLGMAKYAQGSDPKDMIQDSVPFIFDVQKDEINVGNPGQRTTDVPGQFTPGGIVEGTYEPGGKVIIRSMTSIPYSIRHLIDLWYWSYPHMQVTGVEAVDDAGGTTKLAASNVGRYLKTLAVANPAAWNSYQALRKAGGKVYVVGGAVRDALLQKEPKDLDLLVAGIPPEAVQEALKSAPGSVDLTGKAFGVFRYRSKGEEVEIALPRTEKSTGDRRSEFDIDVDHNLPVEKDLERRDFTVNSMAVDLDTGQLVDPYGGARDIEERRLRTTHPSSFEEDPTRMVRALVASSRHGLTPDEATRQEMRDNAHRVAREAPERIRAELDKLFASPNPAAAVRMAHDQGLLRYILPEVADNWDYDQNNPHHRYPLGEHLLNVLENTTDLTGDPDVRLAAALHDIGKPRSAWVDPSTGYSHYYPGPDGQGADHAQVGADMAAIRMRALAYPNARIDRVRHLVNHHMFAAFSSPKGARKFLHRVGDEHADDLLTLRQADQMGKGQTPEELAARTSVQQQRGLVEQVRSAQEPTQTSALSVNGNDIVGMGVKPGPDVGRILRQLTDDVIEDPALNDRNTLLQRTQEYVNAIPEG
jgi:tRNA nucleotidyltransferase (CCA-adding enzyme)